MQMPDRRGVCVVLEKRGEDQCGWGVMHGSGGRSGVWKGQPQT